MINGQVQVSQTVYGKKANTRRDHICNEAINAAIELGATR